MSDTPTLPSPPGEDNAGEPCSDRVRDALEFEVLFLEGMLRSADLTATADKAVRQSERAGPRFGDGRHIGPVLARLHAERLISPVTTRDGYRAAIRSQRKARRLGLSGVWRGCNRRDVERALARARAKLERYPQRLKQRRLFGDSND